MRTILDLEGHTDPRKGVLMLNLCLNRSRRRARSLRSLIEANLALTERNYLLMTVLDETVTNLTGAVNQLGADQNAAFTDLEAAIADLKNQLATAGGTPVDTSDVDNAVAALKGLTTQLQQFDANAVQADPKSAVNNPAPVEPAPADPAPVEPAPTA
jgi:hypothetical protein